MSVPLGRHACPPLVVAEHDVDSFDIIDHRGRARRVHPASDGDVVADLAAALDLDRGPLAIEGSMVDGATRLVDVAALRVGAHVGPAAVSDISTSGPEDSAAAVVEIAAVAGPDCGRWRALGPGRYAVGRAADAAISIADPLLEPYVGLLVVDRTGDIDFLQLGGLAPIEVEPHPIDPETQSIDLGATVLVVRPPRAERGDSAMAAGEIHVARSPWQRVVRRASAATAPGARPVPDLPPRLGAPRRVSATGLIASAMSIAGAVVGVVVFGSLMFALFAGLAAIASIATWMASAFGARRAHRRERRSVARAEDDFVASFAAHASELAARGRAGQPTIAQALRVIDGLRTGHERSTVWMGGFTTVDEHDRTAIRIPIGRGAVAIDTAPLDGIDDHVATRIAAATVADDMPIDIVVDCGQVVAVHADVAQAASLARAVVLQLATWHGPSELRLDAIGEATADWSWMRW
ncbi:MAG: hypothetical protein AAFY28_06665, partial [Actinomycetota bacterium]